MRRVTLYKLGVMCGIFAPVIWASSIALCGSLRPGYSHLTQYISELGERGSSTELLMRYAGFLPTGVMHVLFAGSLYSAFKGSKSASAGALLLVLNGLGRVAAGLFPCEAGCAEPGVLLSQKLHSLSAGVGFIALIGAAILWGFILRRRGRRKLGAYSVVSGLAGLLFLLLMLSSAESRTGTGLYERLSTGILSLWVLVFAASLWLHKPSEWGDAT